MKEYRVKQYQSKKEIVVEVPGSKSITNRALLLAALSAGTCRLEGALFSDDSRAFVSCLQTLGFSVETDEGNKAITVKGEGGKIPLKKAEIDVRSAGTAARFLTVFTAFAGGEYTLRASKQMEKRPMQALLSETSALGAKIEFLEEEGRFPFTIQSRGVTAGRVEIDTNVSSQFASALLLCGAAVKGGLHVKLTGERTGGAYIRMTERMLCEFGVRFEKKGTEYFILPDQTYEKERYRVEPDFSSACYFYAAGALLGVKAKVRGTSLASMQGDKKFLGVLADMGASFSEEEGGVALTSGGNLRGVSVDMQDFSDQALTLAAIAPFASSPTTITGIEHIRKQECDRIFAIVSNLRAMGVQVEERAGGVTIYPCKEIKPTKIQTFGDHRVAMAFAVAGLKSGNITIENPDCSKKTFENFFEILDGLS